jgi:hypothetical protein
MPNGEDTRHHPNRKVGRQFFGGDTRSDELADKHNKEDIGKLSDKTDSSELLPSQQTPASYGQ